MPYFVSYFIPRSPGLRYTPVYRSKDEALAVAGNIRRSGWNVVRVGFTNNRPSYFSQYRR